MMRERPFKIVIWGWGSWRVYCFLFC